MDSIDSSSTSAGGFHSAMDSIDSSSTSAGVNEIIGPSLSVPSLSVASEELAVHITPFAAALLSAKKIANQLLQKERDALSVNAAVQIHSNAVQVASTAPDAKEKFNVDGLTIEANSPPNATSSTWLVFRRYSNEKRDEFAVCLYCKRAGKTNSDSEVKYGSSHSTSKLHQHIASCHKQDHKRKIEAIVEEQRKSGTTLLTALNAVPSVVAVDKFIELVALSCLSLDICEDEKFREMVHSLNPKSPLVNLSRRAAKEKV